MKTFFTILITFIFSFCGFSQTGKILGKIDFKDIQNKKTVSENVYVILKSKRKIDSVKVDQNLEFVFNKIDADSFRIYFSKPSYPINRHYIFNLAEGETKNLNLAYSSTCPYSNPENKKCPICHRRNKVIPIVYGFRANIKFIDKNGIERDSKGKKISKKKKSYSGGCVVSDCQPSWFCERDKMEF